MLSAPDAARYLLRQGLVRPAAVVDGALIIHDASRRNRAFRVEGTGREPYFLKRFAGADAARGAREAAACASLASAGAAIADCVPAVVRADPGAGILVLELVAGGEEFGTHHDRLGRYPTEPAAILGRAVAGLQGVPLPPEAERAEPWALGGHLLRPEGLRELSPAGVELIRVVQDSGLATRLDRLREGWRPEVLVHGDLSWSNVLVGAPDGHDAPPTVTIVDWELCGRGDPAWDVATVLAGYLSAWLFSIRVGPHSAPDAGHGAAGRPLEEMRPAIRACWRAYAGELGLGGDEARSRQVRVARFAAARLVQTAFEAAQAADRLSAGAVLHLQVASNMLEGPSDAASALLGLEPEWDDPPA